MMRADDGRAVAAKVMERGRREGLIDQATGKLTASREWVLRTMLECDREVAAAERKLGRSQAAASPGSRHIA